MFDAVIIVSLGNYGAILAICDKEAMPNPPTAVGIEVPRVTIFDVTVLVIDLRDLQIGHALLFSEFSRIPV
ncbi:hypothetical protein WL94_33275 [Burkholderia cepacia]|nr:hypothetical protein WL94_33275 [Burkholderia cepacia]